MRSKKLLGGLFLVADDELRDELDYQDEHETHEKELLKCALDIAAGEYDAQEARYYDENHDCLQPVQAIPVRLTFKA